MNLRTLYMSLWAYLKWMKPLVKVWLFGLNHYFQSLVWCIMWSHLWKMRAAIWVPWQPHYILSSFVSLWNLSMIMKVHILGMWCLRRANMLLTMTRFSKSLMQVNVKDAQATLQKSITWTKKSSKGRQE